MGIPVRPLGQTGLEFSLLGLGTVKFGRNTDVKYPHHFELPSDAAIIDLLQTAHALGINCLDTAPAYGCSEERLGQLLPAVDGQFHIISKVGEYYDAANGSHYDFSDHAIQTSLEQSLHRLKRNQLDVVLLHSDGRDVEHIRHGALQSLIRARDAGLVKAIGLSGKTVEGGRMALAEGADVLMITLNPQTQLERPLVTEAHAQGAGILVKKALGSGHITDDLPRLLSALFADHGVTSAIIGTTNPTHLRHNCAALPKDQTP